MINMPITQIDHIARNLKKVSFTYKGKKYKSVPIKWRFKGKSKKKVGAYVMVNGKYVLLDV